MNQETFNLLVTIAIFLSALGLLMQGFSAYGMYRAVKSLQGKVEPLIPKAQSALDGATAALEEGKRQIADISKKSSEILAQVNTQLEHFDAARAEVTARVRAQGERLELVIEDTLSRFQDVTESMHRGVMRPVREVSGILAGVRVGLKTWREGGRPTVADATNEDGMFI